MMVAHGLPGHSGEKWGEKWIVQQRESSYDSWRNHLLRGTKLLSMAAALLRLCPQAVKDKRQIM